MSRMNRVMNWKTDWSIIWSTDEIEMDISQFTGLMRWNLWTFYRKKKLRRFIALLLWFVKINKFHSTQLRSYSGTLIALKKNCKTQMFVWRFSSSIDTVGAFGGCFQGPIRTLSFYLDNFFEEFDKTSKCKPFPKGYGYHCTNSSNQIISLLCCVVSIARRVYIANSK